MRLGLAEVNGIGEKLAKKIVEERDRGGLYADMRTTSRAGWGWRPHNSRCSPPLGRSTAWARRPEAMWNAGNAAQNSPPGVLSPHRGGRAAAAVHDAQAKLDEAALRPVADRSLHRQPSC